MKRILNKTICAVVSIVYGRPRINFCKFVQVLRTCVLGTLTGNDGTGLIDFYHVAVTIYNVTYRCGFTGALGAIAVSANFNIIITLKMLMNILM